ncbi:MAG: hypothetical protein DRQ39_05955 [Gammaproteobacteria bacterium]|nr:MAG: hypothetical protein DRQ39_05955 [Gammaproteobacteria bacterium]
MTTNLNDAPLELARQLTELGVRPETNQGQVVALVRSYREDGVSYEEPLDVEQLAELGVDPSLGYVDDHPEGSDRGGYVPYVLCVATYTTTYSDTNHYRVRFDENANEWFPS